MKFSFQNEQSSGNLYKNRNNYNSEIPFEMILTTWNSTGTLWMMHWIINSNWRRGSHPFRHSGCYLRNFKLAGGGWKIDIKRIVIALCFLSDK